MRVARQQNPASPAAEADHREQARSHKKYIMQATDQDSIRQQVRSAYAAVANTASSRCATAPTPAGGCCVPSEQSVVGLLSRGIGYSADETAAVPEGANLGLGCGNPQVIAALKPGECVLDLGSGAGFDCFLAARAVGPQGRVIGVDMTPDMLLKACTNAVKGGYQNVDFRLGEIERLPVADTSVDVIISNCVINLSPDKAQVFRDAYRVLKPGGRLAISDIVLTAELPADMKAEVALYTGCVAGAADVPTLTAMLAAAGFVNIRITPKDTNREYLAQWAPGRGIENYITSANIEAIKPTNFLPLPLGDGIKQNQDKENP